MRRSGSTSCILRPRSSLSFEELSEAERAPTVTVINTKRLPTYSTERYYMLSELELNANCVTFLCDLDAAGELAEASQMAGRGGQGQQQQDDGGWGSEDDTVESSLDAASLGGGVLLSTQSNTRVVLLDAEKRQQPLPSAASHNDGWQQEEEEKKKSKMEKKPLPSHVVLYMLWRPNSPSYSTPTAFSTYVERSVRRILKLQREEGRMHQLSPSSSSKSLLRRVSSSPGFQPGGARTPPPSPRPNRGGGGSARSSFQIGEIDSPLVPSPPSPPPPLSPSRQRNSSIKEPDARDETKIYIVVDRVSGPPTTREEEEEVGDGTPRPLPQSLAADAAVAVSAVQSPPPPLIAEPTEDDRKAHFDSSPATTAANAAAAAATKTDETSFAAPTAEGDTSTNDDPLQHHHETETAISEMLARHIAKSKFLRPLVEGITVGTTSDCRAAPGLEACLEAVNFGRAERRRETRRKRKLWKEHDPTKSGVGIICTHPDDLVGADTTGETDAVQGIMQSSTCAEWNGNGDLKSFGTRGQKLWRVEHGICDDDADGEMKSMDKFDPLAKLRNRRRRGGGGYGPNDLHGEDAAADVFATFMAVAFVVGIVSHLWKRHGDAVVEVWARFAELGS